MAIGRVWTCLGLSIPLSPPSLFQLRPVAESKRSYRTDGPRRSLGGASTAWAFRRPSTARSLGRGPAGRSRTSDGRRRWTATGAKGQREAKDEEITKEK